MYDCRGHYPVVEVVSLWAGSRRRPYFIVDGEHLTDLSHNDVSPERATYRVRCKGCGASYGPLHYDRLDTLPTWARRAFDDAFPRIRSAFRALAASPAPSGDWTELRRLIDSGYAMEAAEFAKRMATENMGSARAGGETR